MRYVCSICGYVYDEAQNPPWNTLSDDWKCPLCGAAKGVFRPEGTQQTAPITAVSALPTDLRPLTAMELSAVCSNLARGCEKQYKADQAAAFTRLAERLREQAEPIADPTFDSLLGKIEQDLSEAENGCRKKCTGLDRQHISGQKRAPEEATLLSWNYPQT